MEAEVSALRRAVQARRLRNTRKRRRISKIASAACHIAAMNVRSLCLWGAIAGLVLGKTMIVLVQQGATSLPDPATGRTEPFRFATVISLDPQYITSAQVWAINVSVAITIGCLLGWAGLGLRERFRRDA